MTKNCTGLKTIKGGGTCMIKKVSLLLAIFALCSIAFSGCWETEDKSFLDDVKGWFEKTDEVPSDDTSNDVVLEFPEGEILLRLDPTCETVRLTYVLVSEKGQEYEYVCLGKVDKMYPPTLHFATMSEELNQGIETIVTCSSKLTDELCEYIISREAQEFCVDENDVQWYLYVSDATVLNLSN